MISLMRKIVLALIVLIIVGNLSAQRLPHGVTPENYTIKYGIDLATGEFTGDEYIAVKLSSYTPFITLNSVDLKLNDIYLEQHNQQFPGTLEIDTAKEMVRILFVNPVPRGEARLHISFRGKLRDDLRGLYLTKSSRRNYAVTQFEGTYARMAFPSFDEPNYKATFDISVVIDKGDTAISNGHIKSDIAGPGKDKHTIQFATSPKMSTYLVALAVGDFACSERNADGIPIRVCALPEKKALTEFSADIAADYIKFYNQWFGIRYPFGKLDMLAIPDYEWGGMENTASIFYKEGALLLDPKTASVNAKRGVASVVAHEMAHQWFGDLVTAKWWDDIWLNEGFATWMAHKPLVGWDKTWDQDVSAAQASAFVMGVDAAAATRAIRAKAETPGEIKEMFDGVTYEKGGAVLRMLEHYVGAEVFRKATNAYLVKHANGNATAEDFWLEVKKASNKPVDEIMATFIDQPGEPLISASWKCVNGQTKLHLKQERFYQNAALMKKGSDEVWKVPVCMRGLTKNGFERCEVMSAREQDFTLASCAPLELNPNMTGYYRVAYDNDALIGVLNNLVTGLNDAERLALLNDQWALVRANRATAADYMAIASGMGEVHSPVVMQSLINRLSSIRSTLVTESGKDKFNQWYRKILTPAMLDVGWEPKPGESDDQRNLRAFLLDALCDAGDQQAIDFASNLALSALNGEPAKDGGLTNIAIAQAAQHGDAKLYDAFLKASQEAKTPEAQGRYFFALTDFTDPALIDRNLALIISPDMRAQNIIGFTSSLLNNPASRDKTWTFLKDHWSDLKTKVVSFGGGGAVGALDGYCDAASRDDIQKFFATHDAPGAERTLKRSIESINNCIELKQLQQASMEKWLQRQ